MKTNWQNIGELPEEIRNRMGSLQQQAFLEAYSKAVASGLSEGEAYAKGYKAALTVDGRVVPHQKFTAIGVWETSSGDGNITEQNLEDEVWVVNRRVEVGAPVPLKYDHSTDKEAIPVGVLMNGVREGSGGYADLYIFMDAVGDLGDGKGSRILCTVDQMADALLTGAMHLSIEGWRNVSSKTYYGDREISLEPTAVAVLPAGVLPAVVPEEQIAAGYEHRGDRVLLSNPPPGGGNPMEGGEMNEEQVKALIEAALEPLKASIDEIKKALSSKPEPKEEDAKNVEDLEAELAEANKNLQAEKDKQTEAEVAALRTKVDAKLLPGQKEKLEAEITSCGSPAEKLAVLRRMDNVLPEITDAQRKLLAGHAKGGKKTDPYTEKVQAHIKENGSNRLQAGLAALEEMDDEFFENATTDIVE